MRLAWAVVPARRFEAAKLRLAPVLGGAERAGFAEHCLRHVLGVLQASEIAKDLAVATDGASAARVARACGARVILDAPNAPLGAIVDQALTELSHASSGSLAVVMADLPWLTVPDLQALREGLSGADVALAPDAARLGTNGLACRRALPTRFGHEDSFLRHLQHVERLGWRAEVVSTAGWARDVDTPADYVGWSDARTGSTKR